MIIEKAKPISYSNVRLRFDQSSTLHSDYLYFLYDLFKDYTLTPPKSTNRKPDVKLYSTIPIINSHHMHMKLDPWVITGITDGEGCFQISVVKNNEYRLGWQCRVKFKITLHGKDKLLLLQIQDFFNGIGSIQSNNNGVLDFIVTDLEEISNIIIWRSPPHFLNF